jgi:hypothetical protein
LREIPQSNTQADIGLQPGSQGSHIWPQPTAPSTNIFYAGDADTNTGVFVSAILARPEVSTPAKVAFVFTEQGPYMDYLQAWIDVTGRRATYVQVSQPDYEGVWGKEFGEEMSLGLNVSEVESDWTAAHKGEVVTAKELGIERGELIGLRETLERERHRL